MHKRQTQFAGLTKIKPPTMTSAPAGNNNNKNNNTCGTPPRAGAPPPPSGVRIVFVIRGAAAPTAANDLEQQRAAFITDMRAAMARFHERLRRQPSAAQAADHRAATRAAACAALARHAQASVVARQRLVNLLTEQPQSQQQGDDSQPMSPALQEGIMRLQERILAAVELRLRRNASDN
jgi:hypothetical protein